jgi:PKHD-type hydroxylase
VLLTFADMINADEHAALLDVARTGTFVDGRESAGPRLADVKHNEQLARRPPEIGDVAKIVGAALQRHSAFQTATLPRHMHSLRLSRYRVGMRYGAHVDSALMTDGDLVARADLSFTLFLNDPDDYDGGELCLETGGGEMRFKLPARAMLSYPTGEVHQVREVTRGERLVVVGWVHSFVRDHGLREALWDLSQSIELVHKSEGKSRAFDLLVKTHANLLRRWAEP